MLAIYKRELRSFFHGMMGYLLTAFLLAASGIYFLALNLGYGLTDFGYYTLYRTIFMLLLYFPVLAMRSLAEERRARTDQLLLTSPVSVWGIVVGKYLALCAGLSTLFLLRSAWLTEAFSAVLSALCLFAPFEEFVNNSFSIPTLVYYLTVTVLFLFFTAQGIEKRRWN